MFAGSVFLFFPICSCFFSACLRACGLCNDNVIIDETGIVNGRSCKGELEVTTRGRGVEEVVVAVCGRFAEQGNIAV